MKEKKEDIKVTTITKKYLVCLFGLLALTILVTIKPTVNSTITEIYYFANFLAVIVMTVLVTCEAYSYKDYIIRAVYYISDMFSIFVVCCCIIQALFVFGFFRANVSGKSMYPTLQDGNTLIVRSTSDVDNFDIIVIEYQDSINGKYHKMLDEDDLLIKRLIAKGGDSFNIRNGNLYLNGNYYDEFYANYLGDLADGTNTGKEFFTIDLSKFVGDGLSYDEEADLYTVWDGYYFAMGDNRYNSLDSRGFGLFQKKQIVGVAKYRFHGLFNWETLNKEVPSNG
ncbi:MAG: signal peptidase I [Bacilli bacterium]|nr:signal peptidase I [Bacilli bacterium]